MSASHQNTVSKDGEHLRLLAIFHYIVAAMTGLFALFPIIHLALGIAVVSGSFDDSSSGEPPPEFLGWFFIGFATIWIVSGLTFAVALALSGRALGRHERYTFSLVMAALACLMMPFGTILGIFTIIVLMRESVRVLYGRPVYAPPTSAPTQL